MDELEASYEEVQAVLRSLPTLEELAKDLPTLEERLAALLEDLPETSQGGRVRKATL